MSALVLDANVAVDWFIPSGPGEAYSAGLVELALRGQVAFHVPLNFEVEVTGQLVRHHRSKPKLYPVRWLKDSLAALDSLPIAQHALGLNFQVLGDLAMSYRLTSYDVQYFHLARMLELPIASRDRGIVSACGTWNVLHWQPQ